MANLRREVICNSALRAWMTESVKPATHYEVLPGRWIAEPSWPPPGKTFRRVFLTDEGLRDATAPQLFTHPVAQLLRYPTALIALPLRSVRLEHRPGGERALATAPGCPPMAETVSDASVCDGRPLSRCRLAVAPGDRAFAISGREPPIPVA